MLFLKLRLLHIIFILLRITLYDDYEGVDHGNAIGIGDDGNGNSNSNSDTVIVIVIVMTLRLIGGANNSSKKYINKNQLWLKIHYPALTS